jgi:predicted nuclease of predicted toxin-antitoxin system
VQFLVDMNLSPKWVSALAQSGIEAVHWSTIGAANTSDPEIMAYAKERGFVVLTNDLDFGSILAATGGRAPSVVQIRTGDCRVESIGTIVLDAINQATDQLAAGALVTIETSRMRVTILPIETGLGRPVS